jgi:hypothetical protein
MPHNEGKWVTGGGTVASRRRELKEKLTSEIRNLQWHTAAVQGNPEGRAYLEETDAFFWDEFRWSLVVLCGVSSNVYMAEAVLEI